MPSIRTAPDPAADVTRRELATVRHWHSVNDLLEHRADLYGVHPLADLIYDAVRWSA